ncbi:MAG: hypothetical protein ACLT1T_06520 [Oscillospiraceae bacterium]
MKAQEAVKLAWQHHTIVPAFNIPYLPMAKPVAQAIIDEKTVAMLQVARLEWEKFESRSLEAVAEEYFKYYDPSTPCCIWTMCPSSTRITSAWTSCPSSSVR